MAKGIIYIMTTVVDGLIKIGKTGSSNFESRMYQLEKNGYANVVGLKRHFAIEVEDYDEKELLVDEIFSKSRLGKTELFALDVNLVVQLLSSFEGKQVYPENVTKEEVFEDVTNKIEVTMIPTDKEFYLRRKMKTWENKNTNGCMRVIDGKYTVLAGSVICPIDGPGSTPDIKAKRKTALIDENRILKENVSFSSPSAAATFVVGNAANGWTEWKTKDGTLLDVYRKHNEI